MTKDLGFFPITVSDMDGNVAEETTVDSGDIVLETVKKLLADFPDQFPPIAGDGQPQAYGAFRDRDARFLGGFEPVHEVLEPGDTVRLLPNVEAG